MRDEYGYPSVFKQFVKNVYGSNLQHRIIPFPQTSQNAARFFRDKGLRPDLIYVDASHEYDDVLADLHAWYPLLSEHGMIFGDDYCKHWHGVMDAVDRFSRYANMSVRHERFENGPGEAPSDYWWYEKKAGCNRHAVCADHPNSSHCYDDDCEDCFGS